MGLNAAKFWNAVLRQDAAAIRTFFLPDAWVNWHNTNEHFTAEEFIRANCEYPGEWDGEIENIVTAGDTTITATHIFPKSRDASFHVVSFIRVQGGKIASIDEYWGDDGDAPVWRQELHIGSRIK